MTNMLLLILIFAWQGDGHEGHNHGPGGHGSPQELDMEKISYVLGNQFGRSLKRDGVAVNVDQFMDGLIQGLEDKGKFEEAQMRTIMMQFQQHMRQVAMEKRNKEAAEAQAGGLAFLEANKKKEGVVALESGLQYKVIKAGEGDSPKLTDKVTVHYKGRLIDGTEFDSSYKRNQPASFNVNGVITGWTEALQKMSPGAKWELYIPSELAYGPNGTRDIPGHSVLIFEVELLKVGE